MEDKSILGTITGLFGKKEQILMG